jgi:hypothetical protein
VRAVSSCVLFQDGSLNNQLHKVRLSFGCQGCN